MSDKTLGERIAPGSVGNFLGGNHIPPATETAEAVIAAIEPEITAVRAYFGCNAVVTTQWSEFQPPTIKVEFGALYGNKEGSLSKEYSDATPSGACWMQINAGRPAARFFKPGKKYFLTFTEAPD